MSVISPVTLLVISSRSLSMQDNPLMMSLIGPSRPLFRFELHPEEEPPPRSSMRSSTSVIIGLILLRASIFRGVGFTFHELITGIKPAISVDTEETLDVTGSLFRVVVTGGGVIVPDDDDEVAVMERVI